MDKLNLIFEKRVIFFKTTSPIEIASAINAKIE